VHPHYEVESYMPSLKKKKYIYLKSREWKNIIYTLHLPFCMILQLHIFAIQFFMHVCTKKWSFCSLFPFLYSSLDVMQKKIICALKWNQRKNKCCRHKKMCRPRMRIKSWEFFLLILMPRTAMVIIFESKHVHTNKYAWSETKANHFYAFWALESSFTTRFYLPLHCQQSEAEIATWKEHSKMHVRKVRYEEELMASLLLQFCCCCEII
jgi:hypothetical protein